MIKKSSSLNPISSKILTILLKSQRFLTTAQISKRAKISWNTSEKYLFDMESKGWVERRGRTKSFWRVVR